MIGLLLSVALLAACPACGDIPADPEGTLERVRAERSFRAGLISSGSSRVAGAEEKKFLDRVAAATGARPLVTEDAAEPLLIQLEEGELDLVVGPLGPDGSSFPAARSGCARPAATSTPRSAGSSPTGRRT